MRKIRTEKQYKIALKRVEELLETENPKEIKELDKLCDLVYEYEKIHYPIP